MSIFGGNVNISVEPEDDEFDEQIDRERINAAVLNEMSDLSSEDEDFQPSLFHRDLRHDNERQPISNVAAYNDDTGSFTTFEKNPSPVKYQSKIPVYSPRRTGEE
jgi:hypothetical protein